MALYFSLLFHASLLVMSYSALSSRNVMICGMEIPPEVDDFSLNFEVTNDLEMNGEEGAKSQEKKGDEMSQGEFSETSKEDGSDDTNSPQTDTSKFKGTNWEKLISDLESTKDLRKKYEEKFDGVLTNSDVSSKYIQRYRHYEDMIVKEVFPTIYSIEKSFKEEIAQSEEVLEKHNERNQIIQDFRNNNLDPEEVIKLQLEGPEKPKKADKLIPLKMTEEERDLYFDRILTDSKESQMQEFMEKFSGYDPDKGDLPLVFRDLYYKNLQRLAYTFSADPTFFTSDYFEENLNKEDYLRNAMSLVSKMKKTKTSTEILFSILDIYEIQERAIFQYFQNEMMWKTYSEEQKKQIRVETIRRVIEKYRPVFESKKIKSYEDVNELYFQKKKQIVDYLLETSPDGYRKADGFFEKGRIHFERFYKKGDTKELKTAIEAWGRVKEFDTSKDQFLYKESYDALVTHLPSLQSPNSSNYQIARENINNILNGRMAFALEKKREREERLLWPKD